MRIVIIALAAVALMVVPAHAWMAVVYMEQMPDRPDLSQEEKVRGLNAYGDIVAILDDSWVENDPRMGNAECWNWPWANGGSFGCVEVTGVTYEEAIAFALDEPINDPDGFAEVARNYYLMIGEMTGQAPTQLINNGFTSQGWAKMKNWFCNKTTGQTPGGKVCP